jgi:hypothetical protein
MKLRLIIDENCRNCKYIIEQLRKTDLIQYIDEIVDYKKYDKIDLVDAVPAIEISDEDRKNIKIDIISGDIRGLLKISQYIYLYKMKK